MNVMESKQAVVGAESMERFKASKRMVKPSVVSRRPISQVPEFGDEALLTMPHRAPRPSVVMVLSGYLIVASLFFLISWVCTMMVGQVRTETYRQQAIRAKQRTKSAERAAKLLANRVEVDLRQDQLEQWAVRNGFVKDSVAVEASRKPQVPDMAAPSAGYVASLR